MTRARDLAAFVSNADGDIKFDTDTLFVDSSENRVGIGIQTPNDNLHINSTGVTSLRLSGDTGASYALGENSGATDGDSLFRLFGYQGSTFYGSMDVRRRAGNEGRIVQRFRTNSGNRDMNVFDGVEAVFNEDSQNTDFRIESDNVANAFVVDGATNSVMVGTNSVNTNMASPQFQVGAACGIKSFAVNSNTLTDTGINVNHDGAGCAAMVLASNHYSSGAATRAGQYFLQFYYDGNHLPAVTQVAGTTGIVTFGKSASNTLTIQMPAGGNHITFFMSG